MTEQTIPEPTAFGAVVLDVAAERGVGDPANLELRDEAHKALEDHMSGRRNYAHLDLCLDVALALGLDPEDPASSQDAQDLTRLSLAYTFGELAKSAL
jgi:pyrroloquinoline quinone (PQQ) biosynthesis protein C